MLDYTERLKTCTHEDEVWALMQGMVYPNSNNSTFENETLHIRKNSLSFASVIPPLGHLGLAYRTLLYLLLDGEMGNAPVNGGNYTVASGFLLIIRELQIYGRFEAPSELTGEMVDSYILAQRKSGNSERTIRQKLIHLEKWVAYAYLLPFFLQLPYDLIASCKEWNSVLEGSSEEQSAYQNGLGSSREPFPLNQWTIIITEAIDYIEAYAEDCLFAAQLYKDLRSQNPSDYTSINNATKRFPLY